jgi:hypothetical protein
LNERQLTLLDSIKYKDANLVGLREKDEQNWRTKYEELKRFASKTGVLKGLPSHLRSWKNRQKQKFREHSLDREKQRLLEAIGVVLLSRGERGGSDSRKKTNGEVWHQNFRRLQQYQEVHGHCNVRYRFVEDPSLGVWVHNQRARYKRVKGCGYEEKKREAEDSWISLGLLEGIDFEWTRKPEQSKLRNRSWSRVKK